MNIVGNVKNKNCVIVDDIIDSGGTIVNAAKALKEKGAKDVYVYITHAVLSGEAVHKIEIETKFSDRELEIEIDAHIHRVTGEEDFYRIVARHG